MSARQGNSGTLLSVRSSVFDARFERRVRAILRAMRGGKCQRLVIEVVTHLDSHTVRGIALTSNGESLWPAF